MRPAEPCWNCCRPGFIRKPCWPRCAPSFSTTRAPAISAHQPGWSRPAVPSGFWRQPTNGAIPSTSRGPAPSGNQWFAWPLGKMPLRCGVTEPEPFWNAGWRAAKALRPALATCIASPDRSGSFFQAHQPARPGAEPREAESSATASTSFCATTWAALLEGAICRGELQPRGTADGRAFAGSSLQDNPRVASKDGPWRRDCLAIFPILCSGTPDLSQLASDGAGRQARSKVRWPPARKRTCGSAGPGTLHPPRAASEARSWWSGCGKPLRPRLFCPSLETKWGLALGS